MWFPKGSIMGNNSHSLLGMDYRVPPSPFSLLILVTFIQSPFEVQYTLIWHHLLVGLNSRIDAITGTLRTWGRWTIDKQYHLAQEARENDFPSKIVCVDQKYDRCRNRNALRTSPFSRRGKSSHPKIPPPTVRTNRMFPICISGIGDPSRTCPGYRYNFKPHLPVPVLYTGTTGRITIISLITMSLASSRKQIAPLLEYAGIHASQISSVQTS